jgi:hypothetical protein
MIVAFLLANVNAVDFFIVSIQIPMIFGILIVLFTKKCHYFFKFQRLNSTVILNGIKIKYH